MDVTSNVSLVKIKQNSIILSLQNVLPSKLQKVILETFSSSLTPYGIYANEIDYI
jgi:hypothetical protein